MNLAAYTQINDMDQYLSLYFSLSYNKITSFVYQSIFSVPVAHEVVLTLKHNNVRVSL